jgi:general secretion pathway protein M
MWDRLENTLRDSAAGRWFVGLEYNERMLVAALAALVVLAIIYVALWRPLHVWSSDADRRYEHQLALLDWMRQQEGAAREAAQHVQGAPASGSLLTVVANSAASAGLQLVRYQPEASGGVSVVLQNQPFNALIEWLAQLEQRDSVAVKQISIDGQTKNGLVNARINFI